MPNKLLGFFAYTTFALLGGCAPTYFDSSRGDLNVPEVNTSAPIPLRVAVHIHPAVVRDSHTWGTISGDRWRADLGPEIVNAVAEYFPQVFNQAWLLADFPKQGLNPETVDAVVVIESSCNFQVFPPPFASEQRYDNEL